MSVDYASLATTPRLLIEAKLRPLQGDRFQATGFPDLGAARYSRPDGTEMLLVESAQSVANRMELACWDESADDLIPELKGLPYVRVDCGEQGRTNTIEEFHRLNSPYIWGGIETISAKKFREEFLQDAGIKSARKKKASKTDVDLDSADVPGVLNLRKFYRAAFKWDPNSVIHGLFLEKVAGRLRMARLLSGFIEASRVQVAESGGTKVDQVLPSPKALGLSADEGYGNVPFHRTEFTAERIMAYFNFDLAQLRGYGFCETANQMLIALSLLKIRRFLSSGLRLRSACDLDLASLRVTRPDNFTIPSEEDLLVECKRLIEGCIKQGLFASVTELNWEPARRRNENQTVENGAGADNEEPAEPAS